MKKKILILIAGYTAFALYICYGTPTPQLTTSGESLVNSIYGHPDYEPRPQEDSVLEGIHTVLQYNIEKIQLHGIYDATTRK